MPVLQRRSQMMQDGIGRNAREEHGSGTMEVHTAGGMHPFTMRYLPLAESDAEEAARLYTEIFSADEPTTQRRGPDTAVFLQYARLYAGTLVKKGLSFIARDERTKEIAGFIFCIDMADDLAGEGAAIAALLAFFQEVVTMIDELEGRYFNRAEMPTGTALHIFQIGVARSYRGCGVAQALILRALAHAHERGYSQAVADCTWPPSRKAFERCGFFEAGFLPYESFSINGSRYFAGIDGGISLMVRNL